MTEQWKGRQTKSKKGQLNKEWSGRGRQGKNERRKRDSKGKHATERDRARESKHV